MSEEKHEFEKPRGFWGSEILQTQTKMQAKMFLDAALIAFTAQLVLLFFWLAHKYGFGTLLTNINTYIQAKYMSFMHVQKQYLLCVNTSCTKQAYFPASTAAQAYGQWLGQVWKTTISFLAFSIFLYPLAIWGLLHIFRKKAQEVAKAEHLRGRKILSEKELAKELPKPRRLPLLEKVQLPVEYETQHLLVLGKTGMGKTTILAQQMEVVRNEGLKAIVYDYKGDYIRRFYRYGVDKIFNPLDKRCVPWNIFNDIHNELDARALADSLVPPSEGGEGKFWRDGTREIFFAILRSCWKNGETTNRAVWEKISLPPDKMYEYFEKEKENNALSFLSQASGQYAGMKASLVQYTGFLEKFSEVDGDFSLSGWVKSDGGDWLFVVQNPSAEHMLRPVLSLAIDHLSREVLSMPNDLNRRIFFFVDEFGTLQRLPSVIKFLTVARSKGGCLIAGTQDVGNIESRYGRNLLDTLLSNFTNLLSLGVDGATAELISKNFGEEETTETNTHYNFGPEEVRDGISLQKQRKIKQVVLASELSSLKKFEAYVKLTEGQLGKGEIPKKFVQEDESIEFFVPAENLGMAKNVETQIEKENEVQA